MNRITKKKAKEIEGRGYEMTGYILTNPDTGERAFVELGRVTWIAAESAEIVLGHRTEVSCPLTEGKIKSNIKIQKPGVTPPPPPPPIPKRTIRDDQED